MHSGAGSTKIFEVSVWVLAGLAVAYLLIAAYFGYAVGHAMHEAKANPLIGMVAGAIGRDDSERYAIARARIPAYIVKAPTFWIALRLYE